MGPGNDDLGTPGIPADLHYVDLEPAALGELLAPDLLAHGEDGLGGVRAGADLKGGVAGTGIHAGDDAGEDLVLLGVELVIDHAALGLPQALDDDLLAVAGGDAAELHVVHGKVDGVADLILGGEGPGLLQGHLVGGIHVILLVHHGLLDIHLQGLMLLVHVHDNVLHVGVVPLVGGGQGLDDLIHHEGLGDVALLLQQGQRREDLGAVHAGGFFLLLLASRCHCL